MPERTWVFDTVVLSNFLLADASHLLTRYAGHSIIPHAVYDELTIGARTRQGLAEIERLLNDCIFELVSLTRSEHKVWEELTRTLGRGEASCIAVACERQAVVVTDDRVARRHCAERGVQCTGTIGMLRAGVRDSDLSAADADAVLDMMVSAGFYSPVKRVSDLLP